MGLLSLFQRKARQQAGGAPARSNVDPAAAAEAVREARTRARRRLMGATVLLLVGIIGFPLLFETRPRPIPVDLPIEIPARNGATAAGDASPAPRVNRLATPPHTVDAATAASAAPGPTPAPVPIVTEPAPAPVATAPASAPAPRASSTTPAVAVATKPSASRPAASSASASPARPAPATAPAPVPSRPAAATASADRPGDKPADKPGDAAADSGHFVVQIGAFAEQPKAHEARMKVEKLGLKTYVQVVDTAQGKRIRVRVGPYATKAEADKAAAKIKGDGLPAAVLQL